MASQDDGPFRQHSGCAVLVHVTDPPKALASLNAFAGRWGMTEWGEKGEKIKNKRRCSRRLYFSVFMFSHQLGGPVKEGGILKMLPLKCSHPENPHKWLNFRRTECYLLSSTSLNFKGIVEKNVDVDIKQSCRRMT